MVLDFHFKFKYETADWVKQYGFPQHHLRIISRHVDVDGKRWYWRFDTTLSRSHADYSWIAADELEANSELVMRAQHGIHAWEILQRCEKLCCLKYSIPQRQDCESLQRFIQFGNENDRFSTQVWNVIGASLLVGVVVMASRNN
jgi:hypothetical protein